MKLLKATMIALLLSICNAYGQREAMTFEQAAEKGKSYVHLDSLYKSAIHTDKKLAVFQSEKEQLRLQQAYQQLILNLAQFLKEHDFKWGKLTRCFNRIYFNGNGEIDYFLYEFPKDEITTEQENEFDRLLNQFVKEYRINLMTKEKFAQCSPVKYNDL